MGAILAAVLALSMTPLSQTAAKRPTEYQVRAAIERMLKSPDKVRGSDVSAVVRFAEESERVQVELAAGLLPVAEGRQGQMFMGYHIAGAVKFDLDNPKKAKDLVADKVAAVRATMIAYREIQRSRPGYKVELLEKLAALDKQGKLSAHAKSVMASYQKK